MKTIKHVLPAVCITLIIAVILLLLYRGIYSYAEEKCWQELSNTAEQLTDGIASEFEDDVAKLHIMQGILQKNNFEKQDCLDALYLDNVLPTTMFSRIDVWYPDNTVVSSGNKRKMNQNIVFEKVAAEGEHMSSRTTDSVTGRESIYYILPITDNSSTIAMLIGVIDLKEISERFCPVIYDGKGQICVIDSEDGNFIIDSWHNELGNAYEFENRKPAKGYENVNLREMIKNLETGVAVFESKTTGKPLYMYVTPVNVYDWQFAIFAQEDTIFEYMLYLRRYILIFGTLITLLTLLYFALNISAVSQLNHKIIELEENKKLLKQIIYTDPLTSINSRTKYTEVWKDLKERSLNKIGVAYFDLNGLKQINDSKSHDEGDKYICGAAEIIFEIFQDDCYRIGGDEFVVLSVDIDEAIFTERISQVRRLTEERDISISIGYCWMEMCDNIRMMRKIAEEQMYKEKKTYYLTHDRRHKTM